MAGKADPMLNSAQGSSRDILAGMAGVGHSTYEHAITILDKAPEAVIEAVRKEELSINAGYEVTKLPEAKQDEITERIKHGEPAKTVVRSVMSEARDSLNFLILNRLSPKGLRPKTNLHPKCSPLMPEAIIMIPL